MRRWADENNRQPDSENAWGAVFKGIEWTPIGVKQSRYKTNHCRRVFTWRYTPEKKMEAMTVFLNRVREMYGNTNAVFMPTLYRLLRGQRVKAILTERWENQELERMVDAVALGKKSKHGENLLRVEKNGRRWTVKARNSQILINW